MTTEPKKPFIIKASGTDLLAVNVWAFAAGGVLLLALLLVRGLFALALFCGGLCVLAAWLAGDYWLWKKRGIRIVSVDEGGILLFRGEGLRPSRIEAREITGVDVFRKLGRVTLNVLLSGAVNRVLPGVRVFSGKRIRITSDAFDGREFEALVEELKRLSPTSPSS